VYLIHYLPASKLCKVYPKKDHRQILPAGLTSIMTSTVQLDKPVCFLPRIPDSQNYLIVGHLFDLWSVYNAIYRYRAILFAFFLKRIYTQQTYFLTDRHPTGGI
jgi:hypothetical protein